VGRNRGAVDNDRRFLISPNVFGAESGVEGLMSAFGTEQQEAVFSGHADGKTSTELVVEAKRNGDAEAGAAAVEGFRCGAIVRDEEACSAGHQADIGDPAEHIDDIADADIGAHFGDGRGAGKDAAVEFDEQIERIGEAIGQVRLCAEAL